MSICYNLVCIDCGESFHLGKSVKLQSEFHKIPSYGFSNIGSVNGEISDSHKQLLVGLQHFLILHRQHELRVLPDDTAAVQNSWTWFDDFDMSEGGLDHLLSLSVKPPSPGYKPDIEDSIDTLILQRLNVNAKIAQKKYFMKWEEK